MHAIAAGWGVEYESGLLRWELVCSLRSHPQSLCICHSLEVFAPKALRCKCDNITVKTLFG